MNYTSGLAAEIMIKKVIKELGFEAECPVTYQQVVDAIDQSTHPHYSSAWHFIDRIYGTYDVPVETLVDYALGIDGFIEANDGSTVTLDITVDTSLARYNHKCNVQRVSRAVRNQLGLTNHLIVTLQTNKSYKQLTSDDKWLIVDSILDAIENSKKDITIYL